MVVGWAVPTVYSWKKMISISKTPISPKKKLFARVIAVTRMGGTHYDATLYGGSIIKNPLVQAKLLNIICQISRTARKIS
jgi:hypothetical protein